MESKDKSSILIIAGMHRSGTSLTASLLQSAGLHIGRKLLDQSHGASERHFENLDFFEFHKAVLRSQGGNEDGWTLQETIEVDDRFVEQAQELVAKNAVSSVWGWKEPRTTLFLEFWANLLPEAKFLLIYRFPWEVVDSLYRRGDRVFQSQPELAVKMWLHYNRKILNLYNQFSDRCFLVNLHVLVNHLDTVLSAIHQKFQFNLAAPTSTLYNPSQIHKKSIKGHRASLITHYFPEAIEMYRELEARAWQLNDTPDFSWIDQLKASPYRTWAFQDWLQVGNWEGEKSKLHQELENSRSQLQQNQKELESSRSQLQQNQKELENSRSQLQQTQAELEQARSQVQQTQAELEQSRSQVQQTQAELEQSRSQLQQTQAELEQARSQVQQTQGELEESRSQLQQTQGELEQSQSQLHQTEEVLEQSQSQLHQTEEVLERSYEKFKQSQSDLEKSNSELERMKENLEEERSQRHQSQQELQQVYSQLQDTQNQLQQSSSQHHETQKELEQTQLILHQTEEALEKSQSQLPETEKVLEEERIQYKQIQEELKQSQSQLHQTQEELQQSGVSLNQIEALLLQSQSQLHQTEAIVEQYRSRLSQTEQELKRVQSQLHQAKVEQEQSKAQFQKAQNELDRLRFEKIVAGQPDESYQHLVREAWYAYRNNDWTAMTRFLQQSMKYNVLSRTETVLNWLESFGKFSAQEGETLDTQALTTSEEWQHLIRRTIAMKSLAISKSEV